MTLTRRATVVLSASVALVAASFLAAGCGSGSKSAASGGGIVPTKVEVLVSVNLDQSGSGPFAQMRKVLDRIPAFQLVDQKIPTAQALVDEASSKSGSGASNVQWSDIKPWLGKSAGLAVWGADADETSSPVSGIGWVATTDSSKALAFMKKAVGDGTHKSVKGITVHTDPKNDGKAGVYAVVGKELVIGTSVDAITDAIDASKGSSFDASKPTDFGSNRTPLVTVTATKALFSDQKVWDALSSDESSASGSTTAADSQRVEGLMQQVAKNLDWVTLGVGADSNGLWFDTLGSGANVKGGSGNAFDDLGKLPQSTLLGAATTHGLAKNQKGLQQLAQTLPTLLQGAVSSNPKLGPFAQQLQKTMTSLTSSETTQLVQKAYSGADQFALVSSSQGAALVSKYGVSDQSSAQQFTQALFGQLTPLATSAGLTLKATADGSFTVGNLPTKQFLSGFGEGVGTTGTAGKLAKAASQSAFVREFSKPTLTGSVTFGSDTETVEFPSGIPTSDSLSSNKQYTKDLAAAKVPGDASSAFWFDLPDTVTSVVNGLYPQALPLVQGQVSHVGGIVVWSTVSGSTAHGELYLPLYS